MFVFYLKFQHWHAFLFLHGLCSLTVLFMILQNYHSNRDRMPSGRGRTQVPRTHGQLHKHALDNGLCGTPQVMSSEHGNELSEAEYPHLGMERPYH